MKCVLLSFFIICWYTVTYAQHTEEKINEIKDRIAGVESYNEFTVFFLDQEEFLDHKEDHGSQIEGYYEQEGLRKIVKTVSMPALEIKTVFYFFDDQLIYASYQQWVYAKIIGADGNEELDYSNSYIKYETKHYFDKGEKIGDEIIGEPILEVALGQEFIAYAMRMKALLNNKYHNRTVYESLQGKWKHVDDTDDYIIFRGTLRFDFISKKLVKRLKTTITNDILMCKSAKIGGTDSHVYRIGYVTADLLALIDLSTNVELMYARREQIKE